MCVIIIFHDLRGRLDLILHLISNRPPVLNLRAGGNILAKSILDELSRDRFARDEIGVLPRRACRVSDAVVKSHLFDFAGAVRFQIESDIFPKLILVFVARDRDTVLRIRGG